MNGETNHLILSQKPQKGAPDATNSSGCCSSLGVKGLKPLLGFRPFQLVDVVHPRYPVKPGPISFEKHGPLPAPHGGACRHSRVEGIGVCHHSGLQRGRASPTCGNPTFNLVVLDGFAPLDNNHSRPSPNSHSFTQEAFPGGN